MNSAVRNIVMASVSLAALAALAPGAFAADVSLSNVTVTGPNGKSKAALAKVDFIGTNLSRAEVEKLFNADTSKDERVAITSKMTADRVSIPEIVITRSDEPGQVSVKGVLITKVSSGKFGSFGFDSLAGKIPVEKNQGDVTFSSGKLTIADGNISRALTAIGGGDVADATWQFGKFSWVNFQATFPEKTRNEPVFHTIKFASISGETKYDGDVPTATSLETTGLSFVPAPNSQAGQGMAAFGYKQIDLGINFTGTYDAASKVMKMNDFTLKGADTGVLSVSGNFGNIDKAAFTGDGRQRSLAMLQGDIDNLKISFTNNGLFDKAVSFYAMMKGSQPDAVKQEWAGMVGGMLPMFLGGDATAMQSASAVTDFIKNPKNITITASGKAGAVPFMEFASMGNPMQLLGKLRIGITANR